MRPRAFTYHRPTSVDAVIALLAEHGNAARLLAGGQSLVPLMNHRLATPAHLIDLQGVAELHHVEAAPDDIVLGAMVTAAQLHDEPGLRAACPLLAAAAGHVGHRPIRSRSTVGGALAFADPAAEVPTALATLGAKIEIASPTGRRQALAEELRGMPFDSGLRADEVVVAVRIDAPAPAGWGIVELAARYNDRATAGAIVTLTATARDRWTARVGLLARADGPPVLRAEDLAAGVSAATIVARAGLADPRTGAQVTNLQRRLLAVAATRASAAAARLAWPLNDMEDHRVPSHA